MPDIEPSGTSGTPSSTGSQTVDKEYMLGIIDQIYRAADGSVYKGYYLSDYRDEMIKQGSAGYVNDVDVRLYTESGSLKKSSISSYNNVEIFEYTATEAGSFYVQVKLHDYIAATENTYLKIALVWDIE